MSAVDTGSEDAVDAIAADFAERARRGENPRITELLALHPEHADALAEILPTVAGLENLRRADTPKPPLERLGPYRILREIGRGGMGVVYEAEEPQLARRVAVKVVSDETSANARSLERFQREARLAARLVHPNIVPVHGYGDEQGIRYFAMHLVAGFGLDRIVDAAAAGFVPNEPGDPLAGLVRDQLAGRSRRGDRRLNRTPAWRQSACLAIAQAADALACAHAQGVLHRDIKPPNLILDRDGHLWVADFGLAKACDDVAITASGVITGTLRYLAPETFDGRHDAQSDVYSLGLTLYEILALRPAFNGASRSELFKAVISGRVELQELRQADPDLPTAMMQVVANACAARPENRYRDAATFARDLREVAAGRRIPSQSLTAVARSPSPWLIAMLIGAALGLAALLLFWPRKNPPSNPILPPPTIAPAQTAAGNPVVTPKADPTPADQVRPLPGQPGAIPPQGFDPERPPPFPPPGIRPEDRPWPPPGLPNREASKNSGGGLLRWRFSHADGSSAIPGDRLLRRRVLDRLSEDPPGPGRQRPPRRDPPLNESRPGQQGPEPRLPPR